MKELLEALILGIVQGLTEFLPVSSSGHLEIAKVLLGDDSLSQESMLVTVLLHFATACATLYVFRKDIIKLIRDVLKKEGGEAGRFAVNILISMIPAVFVGLFLDELIESLFNRNLLLVGCMLFITAILLYFADLAKTKSNSIRFLDALIIGIAQAIAILPGVSRSGATIASSILLGIEREQAARFSFLMVIPLIFGKILKDILDGGLFEHMPSVPYILIGFFSAFFVGIAACIWMIDIVKKAKLRYFAAYCLLVAVLIIAIQIN